MSNEDNPHIKANVEVIREYLCVEFKGFEVTEKNDVPVSWMFTVTKSADERYQLKIFWAQLSDKSNTPERIKKRLVTDDVAGRMKGKSQGEYFLWGPAAAISDGDRSREVAGFSSMAAAAPLTISHE